MFDALLPFIHSQSHPDASYWSHTYNIVKLSEHNVEFELDAASWTIMIISLFRRSRYSSKIYYLKIYFMSLWGCPNTGCFIILFEETGINVFRQTFQLLGQTFTFFVCFKMSSLFIAYRKISFLAWLLMKVNITS